MMRATATMTRQELIHRYFDDELSAEWRRHVEATMNDAERAELAALTELRGLLRACVGAGEREPLSGRRQCWPGASTTDAGPPRRRTSFRPRR
jgi:anti-sigma factor RsiW